MADQQRVEKVMQGLRALQDQPLSIIRLSETISAENSSAPQQQQQGQGQAQEQRSSDVSSSGFNDASPASLEADLTHYKELFSKLRFSYLEQVTKEKFLRAIVGDPPQIVEPSENLALETHLAETKRILQAQKQEVADLVAESEAAARLLSRRYETIKLQTELLGTLPKEIAGLAGTIAELRASNRRRGGGRVGPEGDEGQEAEEEEDDERPELSLPLEATKELVEEKRARARELDAQLKALRQGLPRQTRMLEQEEREFKLLEGERARTVAAAREAMERKKAGGGVDELEMKGRWLKGVEMGLKEMLEV